MKKRQNYFSNTAAAYIPWIAHAVRVGDLVFAGGGIPRDPKTLEIPYDFKDQCKLALDNLEARLNSAGTSLKNGVMVYVWLSDLINYKDLNDLYQKYIDTSSPPCRSCLQVSRMNNDYQVEIGAVAETSGVKNRQNYTSEKVAGSFPWIAHAVKIGDLVFTGGVVPRDPKTSETPYDFKNQCKLVLENLEVRLNSAGTSLKNGVMVHVWLSDLINYKDLNDLYQKYIDTSSPPCRSCLQVSRMNNDYQVEMDAIAETSGVKKRQNYTSEKVAGSFPWIAHAVRVGDLVFTGGVVPRDPKTSETPYDFKDQCKLALDNLEASFNAAGTSLKNSVRVHVWLSDLRNWKDFNDPYRKYIDESNPPSRLALQMSRMNNDFQLEIDAIATMPEG